MADEVMLLDGVMSFATAYQSGKITIDQVPVGMRPTVRQIIRIPAHEFKPFSTKRPAKGARATRQAAIESKRPAIPHVTR